MNLGLSLSLGGMRVGGGPPAPTASNRDFLVMGDSRADDTIGVVAPVAGTTNGQYTYSSYVSWLRALYPHISFNNDADFGIGGQNNTQLNTVPRPGTASKGKDFAASNSADNVILICGTNDGGSLAGRSQLGGVMDTLSSKAIFLLDELPRGKRDDGAVANATSNPVLFRDYVDFLRTQDYAQPGGRSNVAVVNTWDIHVDPATGTLYYNKQGTSADGLHPNPESNYVIAQKIREKVALVHDASVDYVRPFLPTAADPANPTAGEVASYVSRNPFLTGTTGSFFGITGTTSGTIPTGMFLATGGKYAGLSYAVTYDTDPEGYRRINIRVSGTTTTGFSTIGFYEDVGATHLASRGVNPGDTLSAVAMASIDGINGTFELNTGNSAQTGFWIRNIVPLGLRRGLLAADMLPESAYTTPLPFRLPNAPTPVGSTWNANNVGGAPRLGFFVGGIADNTAVDFTIRVSRMTIIKV
jgi:lysophospholipase L1-like esterase